MTLLQLCEILRIHGMTATFAYERDSYGNRNYVIRLTKEHDGTASHLYRKISLDEVLNAYDAEGLIMSYISHQIDELERQVEERRENTFKILDELKNA